MPVEVWKNSLIMMGFEALGPLGMSWTGKRTGDRKTTRTAILRHAVTCKNIPWFNLSSSRKSFLKNAINKINGRNRSPVAHWISSNGSSQNTGQWKKLISSHDMHSYLFEAAHSAAKSKRKAVTQRACWPTQIESQSRKTLATIAIHRGWFLWFPLVLDNTQVQTHTSTQNNNSYVQCTARFRMFIWVLKCHGEDKLGNWSREAPSWPKN